MYEWYIIMPMGYMKYYIFSVIKNKFTIGETEYRAHGFSLSYNCGNLQLL